MVHNARLIPNPKSFVNLPSETTPSTISVTVSYLEMTSPSNRLAPPLRPAESVAIRQAEHPTVSFYRYLYDTVGANWNWTVRRRWTDETLSKVIGDERVEVNVLYVGGTPAGYVELDRRIEGEVEIAYFGLIPEFIGRGLGTHLLDWGLGQAWSYSPRRVWLHTCTLDHPRALDLYRRAGFVVYRREVVEERVEHLLFLPEKQCKPMGN